MTSKATGTSSNYPLSATSSTNDPTDFGGPSFTPSPSGATLTGGAGGSTVYDSGTVSITVNGFPETVSYGNGSTASSIAAGLASAFNSASGSPATSGGGVVTLTSKTIGSSTDYALSATSQTSNPGQFGSPSFTTSASGSTLTGGTGGYNVSLSYAPNGDVLGANDSANGNWTYTYDDFNRLSSANATGQAYTYKYDRFGNRWQQNGPHTMSLSFSAANNRMDGYSYDASGNLLNDGSHSYTYDAESRIVGVDGGAITYAYDANGQRVQKTVSGASVDYVYDLAGHQIAEVNSSGGANREEVYAGGKHLATYTNNTTYFDHADWLGTERVRTAVNGSVCESITSLPFGDGMSTTGSCAGASPLHFTGKERDAESNLDYFGARYFGSSLGRFMSSDPDNISGQMNPDDPQSWNGYSYARNNPLLYTDPDGETYQICTTDQNGKQQCTTVSDAQFDQAQQSNGQSGLFLKNGGVYYTDQNGNQVQAGTYVQTDVDLSSFAVGALGGAYQRSARALGYINDAFDAFFLFVAPEAVGGEVPDVAPGFRGGQFGTASGVPNLSGMSRSEAEAMLKAGNPAKVHTTAGGYTQYKFADGSQIWIRPNGEIVRVPAPGTAPAGSRIDPNGNLTSSHSTGEKIGN